MNKADGARIAIKFDKPLMGDVSGRNPPVGGVVDRLVAPAMGVVYAASSSYTGSLPSEAFDGDISTYWQTRTALPQWIQVDLGYAIAATRFRYYSGASYRIADYKLEGSADENIWFPLWNGTNEASTGWRDISFENSVAYRYYRWTVTSLRTAGRIYVYEFELYATVPIGNEQAFLVTGQEYNYTPQGTLIPRTYAIDSVEPYPVVVRYKEGFQGGDGVGVETADGLQLIKLAKSITDSASYEIASGTSLQGTVTAATGDIVLATITIRNSNPTPTPSGWTWIYEATVPHPDYTQRVAFFCKRVEIAGTVSITATQPTAARIYMNLISFGGVGSITALPSMTVVRTTATGAFAVPDKEAGAAVAWGCSAALWSTTAPFGDWLTTPSDLTRVSLNQVTAQPRLANFIDLGNGAAAGRTMQATPSTNGTYVVVSAVQLDNQHLSAGTYIPAPIDGATLSPAPRIRYATNIPDGTSITIEYAITDNDATPPETWDEAVEGVLLPTVEEGYFLWMRYSLETEDITKTPVLQALWLEEEAAADDAVLLVFNSFSGRFHSVVGGLTVSYDASKGNLGGAGGPVASFSETFTPDGLIAKPGVNDPENIEVTNVTATGTLTEVFYTDTQSAAENIEITGVTATGVLTHIDDI